MRAHKFLGVVAAAPVVVTGAAVQTLSQTRQPAASAEELRPVSSFADIADTQSRSIALFQEAGKVLQHPRCVNCHPVGERPFQGDTMRPHEPLVVRGKDGHGAPCMACTTCHGGANFDPARVPGDPHWHLAPASMAWEGKSAGHICNQLKDPAQRQPRHRRHSQARCDGQPGQVGLEPGARSDPRSRHQRAVRCTVAGVGGYRSTLPRALSAYSRPTLPRIPGRLPRMHWLEPSPRPKRSVGRFGEITPHGRRCVAALSR